MHRLIGQGTLLGILCLQLCLFEYVYVFVVVAESSECARRFDVLRRGHVFLHFKDLKLLKQDDLIFCGKAITVQMDLGSGLA